MAANGFNFDRYSNRANQKTTLYTFNRSNVKLSTNQFLKGWGTPSSKLSPALSHPSYTSSAPTQPPLLWWWWLVGGDRDEQCKKSITGLWSQTYWLLSLHDGECHTIQAHHNLSGRLSQGRHSPFCHFANFIICYKIRDSDSAIGSVRSRQYVFVAHGLEKTIILYLK